MRVLLRTNGPGRAAGQAKTRPPPRVYYRPTRPRVSRALTGRAPSRRPGVLPLLHVVRCPPTVAVGVPAEPTVKHDHSLTPVLINMAMVRVPGVLCHRRRSTCLLAQGFELGGCVGPGNVYQFANNLRVRRYGISQLAEQPQALGTDATGIHLLDHTKAWSARPTRSKHQPTFFRHGPRGSDRAPRGTAHPVFPPVR